MNYIPPVSTVSQASQKAAAVRQDEEPGLLKQAWDFLVGAPDSPNLPVIAPPLSLGGCGVETTDESDIGPDIPPFPHPYGYDNDGDGYYSTEYKQWQKERAVYEKQYGRTIEGCEVCDCNDTDPNVNPSASESCNYKDDNCDGLIDEGFPPKSDEICDDVDNNCDGKIDENSVCYTLYYCDKDKDAYFNEEPDGSCENLNCIPEGCVVAPGIDCNDNEDEIHPEITEATLKINGKSGLLLNDGIDNNCDGYIDEIDINGGEVILGDVSSYYGHTTHVYTGYHGYIHIYNGGILRFNVPSAALETESLTVEAGSTIDISEVTCGSGDGLSGEGSLWSTGGGGAGASHIGKGGNGGSEKGGEAVSSYGSINDFVAEPGSCGGIGGAESGAGGMGGGALSITILKDAVVYGTIRANGGNGGNSSIDGGGGGAGSGGGIFMQAMNFFIDLTSTILSVTGGNGGNAGPGCTGCGNGGGGGGGGGGSIEIIYEENAHIGDASYSPENYPDFINELLSSKRIHLEGGAGGTMGELGEDGQPGAVNTSLPE